MLEDLPYLFDADEAIDYLLNNESNDAEKAYAIGVMAKDGLSNKKIRKAVGIKHVYTATHYIRAGTRLSDEELKMWHNNIVTFRKKKKVSDNVRGRTFNLITLGHIRTLIALPEKHRIELIKRIEKENGENEKPITIKTLTKLMEGYVIKSTDSNDIKTYENDIGEQTNRSVRIKYNKETKTGTIQLSFYLLNDLEFICSAIGYKNKREEDEY